MVELRKAFICILICIMMVATPVSVYGTEGAMVNASGVSNEEVIDSESEVNVQKATPIVDSMFAVPTVTANAGDAGITLSWEAVDKAICYEVINVGTDEIIAENIIETSYYIPDLKNNTAYSYQVRAVGEVTDDGNGVQIVKVSEWSEIVTATPVVGAWGGISKLTAKRYNKGVELAWTAAGNANRYYVYRHDSKTKKWTHIKTTTATTYKNGGLVVGRTYTYTVKPVRVSGGVTVVGTKSPNVSIKAAAYHTTVKPMMYKVNIWAKGNLYTSYENALKGKKCGKIKAGKTAVLVKRKTGFSQIKYNGKYYWFSNFKFSYRSCVYSSSKDYTKETKEAWVNANKYSSKTKYLIWVNGYTQRVNIFQGSKGKWKLIKTSKCCTGRATARTQNGTYKIKYKEKGWFYPSYCCRYVTHFAGRTSFHTRPQTKGGRLTASTLGKPVSNGCVRLPNDVAKYIYKNMPKGTTVVSN